MQRNSNHIVIWLSSIIFMVFLIIFVGGVTRLTHSGLSMVDWSPLIGIVPPLNEAEWLLKFERYKQFPEFQLINDGMNLDGFKSIFFWEYFHRVLGRLVGVVFFIPWLYFLIKRKMTKGFAGKIFSIFILGGLQGLMGWYMVKSGLVNDPNVGHLRLAAHFSLALILICVTFWVILDIRLGERGFGPNEVIAASRLRNFSWVIFSLLWLQIIYGAFTAGLKAGFSYNTYPLMNGEWFPSAFFELEPVWLNIFEGIAAVQFIHRTLGLICLLFIGWFFFKFKNLDADESLSRKVYLLILAVVIQFSIGVLTLVNGVPIALASMHQLFACVLLLLSLWLAHHLTHAHE